MIDKLYNHYLAGYVAAATMAERAPELPDDTRERFAFVLGCHDQRNGERPSAPAAVMADIQSTLPAETAASTVAKPMSDDERRVIVFYDANDRAPFRLGGNPFEVGYGSAATIREAIEMAEQRREDRRGCVISDRNHHACNSRSGSSTDETFTVPR